MEKILHFIDGEETESISGETFISENPATGEAIAQVASGQAGDIDRAVRSADRAFREWSRVPPAERGKLLYRLADKLIDNREEFARAESLDSGKTYQANLHIDVPFCADFWRFYAGAADKLRTPVPNNEYGTHRYAVREPYGVIGAIAPWNFPLVMATLKLSAALACGNTVVMKMAEQTPATVTMLAKLIVETGFPKGVVNVVHGFGNSAGQALVHHPHVKKIAFTGSSLVGKILGEQCGRMTKPALLEMGGKSANIIFADADIDFAVNGALQASLGNNGQFCLAASRILVEESILSKFTEALVEKARRIKLGDPFDATTNCGPIISRKQFERVSDYVEIGKSESAKLLTGGRRPPGLERGYYLEPTVFGEMSPNMRIWNEEIFGPVVGITPFSTEAEAIKLANLCEYGLGAYFWTNDLDRSYRLANALDSGLVFVNMPAYMTPIMPAGIRNLSGTGQNFGLEALENYTKLKGVYVNYSGRIYPWLT